MILSESTRGQGILVAATSSDGTTIDATGSDPDSGLAREASSYYLFAVNNHDSDVLLTVEFGGTAANNLIEKTIKAGEGLVTVVNGLQLEHPVAIKAFASVANKVIIYGEQRKV